VRRASDALRELVIAGFSTNISFHRWLIDHLPFKTGRYDLSVTNDFPFAYRVPKKTARMLHALAALAAHIGDAPHGSYAGEQVAGVLAPSAWVMRNDRHTWTS
jgi:acetyl-CoA carboxylase biotin carboxylase subunit